MRGYLRTTLSMLALGLALGINAGPPATAVAQPIEIRDLSIPAQPLSSALLVLAEQTGLEIVFDARLTEGYTVSALDGPFTDDAALQQLLSGTRLSYRFVDPDTVMLMSMEAVRGDGPIEARPLLVEGGIGSPRRSAAEDAPFLTPGSSAYISREQIERIQPSSPGDIFREVPGVLSGASNDGTSINVNIRSSQGLNRVRTMVEGTQQESSGYQGYAGADQRTYLDPELIGGVEITKGPGGGPYGTGTTSGIVNIRLLDAADLVEDGRNTGFRLRGGLAGNGIEPRVLSWEDSFNRRGTDTGLVQGGNDILSADNWFGSFAGAYRSDRFELVAAYARRQDGNYFAGEDGPETYGPREIRFSPIEAGQEVPNTSEDTESFLVKSTVHFTDGQSLEMGFTRYDSDFGQVYPSSINLWAPQQYDLNTVESNRYWLRYKWESENDLINLQGNVWRTSADESGEFRQAPQENDAWGAEIWNTSVFDTGLGGLSVTYGAEYTRSSAVVTSPDTTRGIRYVPGQGAVTVRETRATAFDGNREVYGGYVNAALTPTDWLTLNAGLRYDGFSAESTSSGFECDVDFTESDAAFRRFSDARRAAFRAPTEEEFWRLIAIADQLEAEFWEVQRTLDGFCGFTTIDSDMEDGRLSPRAGVTIEPLDGLQFFAQYSEGLRAPSLVELGQTVYGPVTVNPDLEPEVVKTWEVGMNFLRDGLFFDDDAFRAKLVYFNNDYDSYITRTGILDSRQGGSIFFFENTPDVTVSGYEASLFYDMGRVFADVNVNIFDEPFNMPAQAIIEQPEYAGTATVGTRWFDERLVLGGRVNFFGEPSLGNQSYWQAYWPSQEIFDVFGSLELSDNFALGFSVENVTDRHYITPLYVSRIPGPGRTARVNFTATF